MSYISCYQKLDVFRPNLVLRLYFPQLTSPLHMYCMGNATAYQQEQYTLVWWIIRGIIWCNIACLKNNCKRKSTFETATVGNLIAWEPGHPQCIFRRWIISIYHTILLFSKIFNGNDYTTNRKTLCYQNRVVKMSVCTMQQSAIGAAIRQSDDTSFRWQCQPRTYVFCVMQFS